MAKLNDKLKELELGERGVAYFRRESWPVNMGPLAFHAVDGGKALKIWMHMRSGGEFLHSPWFPDGDDLTADDWFLTVGPVE